MNAEYLEIIAKELPHISKSLEMFWGYKEFPNYVNTILNDSREGKRAGFPREVASAIFKLLQEHDLEFPQFIEKDVHPWQWY